MPILFIARRRKKTMKELIKNNLKYLIFLAFFGLVGGYFTALYSIQNISQDLLDEAISQVGSIEVLIIVTTFQSFGYALILGIIGKMLAKKIGLWRKVIFERRANIELILVSVIGGAAFVLLDYFIFSNFSEAVKNMYLEKPTFEYIMESITYGGVIEEVMMRLFLMSLLALIIQKAAKKEKINDKILIISNAIVALLFAAGHLPATYTMMAPVTPLMIFRCFLLNGGFGLMFGRLYRKYGIHYAILGHAGVHIVSKLIWILFI